jgi:hypothetical protein
MMQKRGIALCKSVARRLIQQKAVYIDGQLVESMDEEMPVVSREVTIQDGDRVIRRYPISC